MDFSPEQMMLSTRVFSMHRAQLRRKLANMKRGSHEYDLTLKELRETQVLLNMMADQDLAQLDGAA